MQEKTGRKNQIDILRGLVMVLMLLDHVRDFFYLGTVDPLDVSHTTPPLYFTRWVTHFCAPVFVLLSGISARLQLQRYGREVTSVFMITRGLWLILMEWSVIAFAWTFDPGFHFIPFQVIWAIGISMLLSGVLLRTKLKPVYIALFGLFIVCAHNTLDRYESAPDFKSGFLIDLLHNGHFSIYSFLPGHVIAIAYPFLPWTGLMLVGFGLGKLFLPGEESGYRIKILQGLSAVCIAVFIVLRASEIYGDPVPWSGQGNFIYSLMSFLNVRKYPPSLLYMLVTIGPALFLLSLLENADNLFTRVMTVFGRTAFFFYILHLYVVHLGAMFVYLLRGHAFSEATALSHSSPFLFVVPGEGFGLLGVYAVWFLITVLLYPVCLWYDRYKRFHSEKSWLRYI